MQSEYTPPCEQNSYLYRHVELITRSYQRLLGKHLVENHSASSPNLPESIAMALYHAPFAVLSHDTASDPIFNYANLKAQELFEMDWSEFCALPSRLSAEPACREEREKLLENVARRGYSTGYKGVRISKTGRRFLIRNATVWNLYDDSGNYAGQAACLFDWEFLA
jgi:MEKHLA domain